MMRKGRLVLALFSVILSAGVARGAAPQRPAQVMGEVGVAGPDAELLRWNEAIARLSPTTPSPKMDAVAMGLAKLTGAQRLDGLDLGRPITLVLLNPMGFPQPVVLVAQVANKKRLDEALAATPVLTSRVKGKLVVIGSATALDHAGEYAFGRVKAAPARGAHAVAFLETILGTFGGQIQMLKGVLMAQGGQANSAVPMAQLAGMFDGFLSGLGQSTELTFDAAIQAGVPEFSIGLTAKPGSAIDHFISAQKPSDFNVLGRLPAKPVSTLFAGRIVLGDTAGAFLDWIFKKDQLDAASRAELIEMTKVMNGELGGLGNMSNPEAMDLSYLIGTNDAARALTLLPRAHEIISKAGMFGGAATMKVTRAPDTEYDGIKVLQSDLHYDFSKMPGYKGKPLVDVKAAWTGWDKLVGLAIGPDATKSIQQLVDAGRHGTGVYTPSAAVRTSVDRARTLKESIWMRLDMAALMAAQGKAMQGKEQLPAWVKPSVGLGVSGHSVHMRIAIADPQ